MSEAARLYAEQERRQEGLVRARLHEKIRDSLGDERFCECTNRQPHVEGHGWTCYPSWLVTEATGSPSPPVIVCNICGRRLTKQNQKESEQ